MHSADQSFVALFRNIKEFHDFSSLDLEKTAQSCHQQHHVAGEEIVRYHDHTNSVFFILKGAIRINYYAVSGDEVILCDLPAGEMFGELTAIDGLPRSATAIAKTDTLLAFIPAQAFLQLIHINPAFCTAILKRLTSQVRRLTERVYDFSSLDVCDRIYSELLRMAREKMVSPNAALISPAPTHSELACLVSTSREEVSRTMKELKRRNLIMCNGRHWHVLDVAKLTRMVNEVRGSLG
jgi:CRP-like cAMP-binding protein